MTAEIVAHFHCQTGECPRWHTDEQRLYWTDIGTGRLFTFDPRTGESRCCYQGRAVGGFTIQADGSLLLFRDQGNVVIFRDGQVGPTVVESIPGLETTRFNDVIADAEGRVFAGTMSFGAGSNGKLLRLEGDGHVEVVSEGHGTPNGMGFSPDLSKLYFTDSRLRRIYVLAYDRASGAADRPEIWQQMTPEQVPTAGRSDGMTVAADGTIWSARLEAGLVARYAADGTVLETFAIGTPMVTAVTFGGTQLNELYVTTAGGKPDAGSGDRAGALIRLRVAAQGRPEFRSRLG
jgi:sugar lactone lactonase YvrE